MSSGDDRWAASMHDALAARRGGLFIDADGYFYDPDAAAAHAVVVQGGFSTPLREAARMIDDGGESERRAREWMDRKGYTEGDLER